MPIKGGASLSFVPSGSLLEEIHVKVDPGSNSTNILLLDSCPWMSFANAKLERNLCFLITIVSEYVLSPPEVFYLFCDLWSFLVI
jgi:hypothetical protein